MPIVAADINYYLSGGAGNSNPNLSLGGAISTTVVVSGINNNVFDDVTANDARDGRIEYRAVYVKNNHSTLTWKGVMLWLDSNTPAADDAAIAKEATKGSPKQSVLNETTVPEGITFSAPTVKENAISLGDMLPGDVYMIWLRRTVPAGTAAFTGNNFRIICEGDSDA